MLPQGVILMSPHTSGFNDGPPSAALEDQAQGPEWLSDVEGMDELLTSFSQGESPLSALGEHGYFDNINPPSGSDLHDDYQANSTYGSAYEAQNGPPSLEVTDTSVSIRISSVNHPIKSNVFRAHFQTG